MNERAQKRIDAYGSKETNREIFKGSMAYYFDAGNLKPGDMDNFIAAGLKASNRALKDMLRIIYSAPPIPKEQYKNIKVPTLIMVASHDPFCKLKDATIMNDGIENSKIFVNRYSGHSPMWEKPEEWLKGVLDFLKENNLSGEVK